ncbi:MAG: hypothetical protein V4649_03685 [Bacteroidota bacterium]
MLDTRITEGPQDTTRDTRPHNEVRIIHTEHGPLQAACPPPVCGDSFAEIAD